ncbi:major facilitator superfamily domain-containing protein [Microdochium trichocladiopsis]|uniref:Major facilitator superfamily domain-containing protein n=1 Tax=Microdochium trichocladiopsis TaxID=1682393 RepID=A0A9P8YI20_9PEZI|nr:major facilitator superfamily domain-containing protein [Microdochium trichocladiopsis]KAH7038333.1 major facilitator superfamily domain-containing protein [Microdochium trichocladiopsis]
MTDNTAHSQHRERRPGSPGRATADHQSDLDSDTTFGGHTAIGPTVNQTVGAREHNKEKQAGLQGKREITEEECEDELGFAFPSWKKWYILTIIFLVQTSMNFNTSLYSNGIGGISKEFNVSEQAARAGAAIFLVAYGFGCELWAPWSEEFGRKPILQASLFLVNIFTLPVALAPNFGCLLAGRFLGGLSTAGGSVTLGMVADLYDSDNQHYAVAYIVFSSVGGSILGPIVGGFVEQFLDWRWTIWIQLIFGGAVQLLHLLTVPETRTTIMLDRIAKKRRKSGQDPNVYGPDEIVPFRERFSFKELMYTWLRPFRMFLTEPIVLVLSLLSGFSDALIFMCIQSFVLVYGDRWDFNAYQVGLSFIPIGVGYVIGWLAFIPSFERNKKRRMANPDDEYAQYESRLKLLLYLAPCLPLGLIIFAWTSTGPPIPWIASMIGAALIGVANFAIYLATIDYMIAAYTVYSASATGGNGWARDVLAGILTVPATPFYTKIGAEKGMNLQYASTILFCIAFVLVIAVYVIYWKGPELRKKSPFAQSLAAGNAEHEGRRVSVSGNARRRNSAALAAAPAAGDVEKGPATTTPPTTTGRAGQQQQQPQKHPRRPGMHSGATSRHSSFQAASRRHSRDVSRRSSYANASSGAEDGPHGDDDEDHVVPYHLDPIASVPTRQP